jgi:hypothetical protein
MDDQKILKKNISVMKIQKRCELLRHASFLIFFSISAVLVQSAKTANLGIMETAA